MDRDNNGSHNDTPKPPWTKAMTKEQLDRHEKDYFLEWRKNLAVVQESDHLILTPFEKNLEVWRQLWRVVERSDIVIQIVDARNPLFYWSSDLEAYVRELSPEKENVVLVNKSDLLSDVQRLDWFRYFRSKNMNVVFYSALEKPAEEEDSGDEGTTVKVRGHLQLDEEERNILRNFNKFQLLDTDPTVTCHQINDDVIAEQEHEPKLEQEPEEEEEEEEEEPIPEQKPQNDNIEPKVGTYTTKIDEGAVLDCSELLSYLCGMKGDTVDGYTLGFIGYPNVGKSSTLNSLLQEKRVQVSATPGKTKHFQTFKVNINNKNITFCDCPGLVFPTLANSKSEMVCHGVLPIDQMRDHEGPISYLISVIPRIVIESVYGLRLPKPDPLEGDRLPYPYEVLREYGLLRGFMTTRGTPDESRSARVMLKDFVNGKLLYVKPPPDYDSTDDFNPISEKYLERAVKSSAFVKKSSVTKAKENVEENFFKKPEPQMFVKGRVGAPRADGSVVGGGSKPWKKHHKGNAKEKTRRKAHDLDY